MNTFKKLYILFSLVACAPMLGMTSAVADSSYGVTGSSNPPRKGKKQPQLRVHVLKREAHKADEARRRAFRQDFTNALHEKYEQTVEQKMPLRKILRLTEEQKAKKADELKKRNVQLYKKFLSCSMVIHYFMDDRCFTKTSNTFRGEKLRSLVPLDPAIDAATAKIYTNQHARCVMSAMVWATQETIAKYDVDKENEENEEDEHENNE